jgi:predicted Zn-dependent peptidase
MVFKGTKNRSALDIARQMDSIGGNMDAFTGKETICFNAKVLDEHLPIAVDVISDLVLNPTFEPRDIDREKGVILEEIKMDEDNPDYLVHEIFTQNFWKDHPLGKPILGTKETVRALDQAAIIENFQTRFSPGSIIIAAAGSLIHEEFAQLVADRFLHLKPVPNGHIHPAPKISAKIITRNKKSLEQVQLCMGVPAPPIGDEQRYISFILNTLLGGGMSSRLFQKVREEQGLVYSIYSDLNPYSDTGCLCVYAGTSRESAPKVVQSVLDEFKRLKNEPVSVEELERVKDQLKGSLMLSLESSTSRMSNLARQEMYFDRFIDQDEIIQRVEGVTADNITALANQIFRSELVAVTLLGNLNGLKLPRTAIAC